MIEKSKVDISELRQKLSGKSGAAYWRSLEQLAETETFRSFVDAEFPSQVSQLLDPVERRHFLKLMGASLALAGASACTRQPEEKIFPYVKAPEHVVPGKPLFFATAMPLAGVATGLLVESHMGRPTKVEGNRDHPASLGATDCFAQSSILGLYDPDRSQTIRNAGNIRPWSAFAKEISRVMESQRGRKGAGVRLLTGTVTSPTLTKQIEALFQDLPEARWIQYESATRDSIRTASRLAFGREVEARFRLDRADTILALDADLLAGERGSLRYARDFARRRRSGRKPALHGRTEPHQHRGRRRSPLAAAGRSGRGARSGDRRRARHRRPAGRRRRPASGLDRRRWRTTCALPAREPW